MFKPLSIVRNKTRGSWSVCLLHEESGRRYWLDVGLDESYHDFDVDWNQYIFYLADPDDIARKEFQENGENFEAALDAVLNILEEEGEVIQDKHGDWFINKKSWKAETISI